MRRTALAFSSLFLVLLSATCGSEDTTNPPPPPPPSPTIAVAIAGTVTAQQGGSGTTNITVTRGGGFSGAVNLAASGLPANVTASFNPATIPSGSGNGTSVLTLTAAAAAAVASGTYTVTASGTGVSNATATGNVSVTAAPDFSLAATPPTLTVPQSAQGTETITITKTGGFSGGVNLSVSGLPAGVTAAFDNAAPAGTTATLTLTVGAAAAIGNSTITVTGEGTPGQRTTTFTLAVAGAPAGSFTLAVTPSTLSIQAGASGQTTVDISKTGSFTANVTLTATGLPAGATATFTPPSASPPSTARDVTTHSTLQINVGGAVAPTNYPIVIHGNATGQAEKTVNLTLTVTGAAGGGNTSWKFCDLDNLPIFFAFKDGNGAWTAVVGSVAADGTTYSFNILSATGSVAYVTGSPGTGYTTFVVNGTNTELIGFGTNRCQAQPNASRTLTGSVAGLTGTDQAYIGFGNSSGNANAVTTNFQLMQAPNFPADLIAASSVLTSGAGGGISPSKIIIRRGVEYQNNAVIPVLNFTSEGFAPVSATLNINNLNNDNSGIFLNYYTPTTVASLGNFLSSNTSPVTLKGVPPGEQQATDLHQIQISASAGPGSSRVFWTWFKTMENKTVTLGPELTLPTVSNLGNAPYPRYQSTGPIQAEYDDVFLMSSTEGAGTGFRVFAVTSTKGFIGASANYTLVMPDLTAAGYQAIWALAVGVQASFATAAYGNSGNGYLLPAVEGGVQQFGIRSLAVTP